MLHGGFAGVTAKQIQFVAIIFHHTRYLSDIQKTKQQISTLTVISAGCQLGIKQTERGMKEIHSFRPQPSEWCHQHHSSLLHHHGCPGGES